MIRHYLVSGVVQGVGFRSFTQKRAARYGLSGWVRNLHDGRVEAVVSGEPEILDKFTDDLKRGPMLARVAHLEVREIKTEEPLSPNFEVRSTGAESCVFA